MFYNVIMQTQNAGPVIECFACGALVAMSALREHQDLHVEPQPAVKVNIEILMKS